MNDIDALLGRSVELRPFGDSDRLPTGREWRGSRVNRTLPMSIESRLRETLWKIEALFAGG